MFLLGLKEISMKKFFILLLGLTFAVTGCSSKKEAATKIAAGTPAYQLAKDLTAVLPTLDPEKASVLITSRKFDITAGEVIQMFQNSLGNRAAQLKDLDAQRLKDIIEQAAVQLGERKLLIEAATEAKKSATPEEIKSALDAQYAPAGGEPQFLEMLKTNGISIEYVKKSISEDLMIQKYLEGILATSALVTDAEIQKVYGEDKTASVRHILLLTQGKTEAEKTDIRKKMEDILSRAKKGEDFAELAKQYTEDTTSRDGGGLYEDFEHGKMVKPFEDAAFSVPVGEVSDIVETTYGYHILKIENRKKETLPLDQVKSQIEAKIKSQKQASAFNAHVVRLKDTAKFKAVTLTS
jgi:parvulin-like peptidyl-prolyl isomerase